MPKPGFHSLSMWVSYVAGRPSGWPRRLSCSFAQAARAAFSPWRPKSEASWVWFRFFYAPVLMGSVR